MGMRWDNTKLKLCAIEKQTELTTENPNEYNQPLTNIYRIRKEEQKKRNEGKNWYAIEMEVTFGS